jgi:RNA polymerase sigma-70 factor, ECF subfamily
MQTESSLRIDPQQIGKEDLIEIYGRLSPRLFRYAFRLLGDVDLAEECVAETFSRFLRVLKSGGGPRENVQAYLYRMAHNWITDFYRNRIPEETLESGLLAGAAASAGALVTKNMELERVRKALLQLTQEQRQVIMLRFFEEWPHEQIASLIGKTTEATRALQHRALISLRSMLIGPED